MNILTEDLLNSIVKKIYRQYEINGMISFSITKYQYDKYYKMSKKLKKGLVQVYFGRGKVSILEY